MIWSVAITHSTCNERERERIERERVREREGEKRERMIEGERDMSFPLPVNTLKYEVTFGGIEIKLTPFFRCSVKTVS